MIKGGILIDQHNENQFDADGVKQSLIRLRELIRTITCQSVGSDVTACRFANDTYVLDWLIEEVELKDIRE